MDALVIIDVQQGMFTFPGYVPHDGEGTVARIAGLLARARASGTPVFFVQHDGAEGEALTAGSPGFPFRAELAPRDDESVTVKRRCSAFQDTDFDARLRGAGIDHVVVCGMQTEFCVDTAVRSASERGYRVTLVSDGHSTFDRKTLSSAAIVAHHNAVLGDGFATLKRADEVAFEPRPVATSEVAIELSETNDAAIRKIASDGIVAFNADLLGPPHVRHLTISARRGPDIVAGLIGRTSFGWLFVELLFVTEALRGQGFGDRLLAMAEEEAKTRGALGAWLDTFSPEACKFYEKRGYRVFGEIADYPPGASRSFLAKSFANTGSSSS